MKSGFPWRAAAEIDPILADFLDTATAPLPAMTDLAASPTTTEIATAFNALLAALRAAGKMES